MLTSFLCLKQVKFVSATALALTTPSGWKTHPPFAPGSLSFLQVALPPGSTLDSSQGEVWDFLSTHTASYASLIPALITSACAFPITALKILCFPILALTTFASELTTLASTSSITTHIIPALLPNSLP